MSLRLDLRQLFARARPRGKRQRPPWLLGWQGSPLEAPENSRVGAERALQLGLDGFAVSLWLSRDAGLIAASEAWLEDLGAISEHSRAQIAALDLGAQYAPRFRGLAPSCAEDFIQLAAHQRVARWCLCIEELGAVEALSELLPQAPQELRIVSRSAAVLQAASQRGFAALYRAQQWNERSAHLCQTLALRGLWLPVSHWAKPALALPSTLERWTYADHPQDLETALRLGLDGILSSEGLRAQTLHALVARTPKVAQQFPLDLPRWRMEPDPRLGWQAAAEFSIGVRNPFAEAAQVTLGILPRQGAFAIAGLPQVVQLEPQESAQVALSVRGGARLPGADPLLFALFRFADGSKLLLDGPLERVRVVRADSTALRVPLLGDAPSPAGLAVLVRRHRQHLLVSVEGARQLPDLRIEVRVGEELSYGARGVRVVLPQIGELESEGLAFAVRVRWTSAGVAQQASLGGGLPMGPRSGAPGRLVLSGRG